MVTVFAVRRHLARTAELKAALVADGKKLAAKVRDSVGVREAARRTGLSAAYISNLARGKTSISPNAFLLLSEVL